MQGPRTYWEIVEDEEGLITEDDACERAMRERARYEQLRQEGWSDDDARERAQDSWYWKQIEEGI